MVKAGFLRVAANQFAIALSHKLLKAQNGRGKNAAPVFDEANRP